MSTSCGQGAELDEVIGEDATVGRMETQGLVRREQSTRDARADNAVLTDAGLKRYEDATPTHTSACAATFSTTSNASTWTPSATRYNTSSPLPTTGRRSPSPAAAALSQRAELSRPVR